jgi:catechol 2,3-dioxygenase
MGHVHLHVGNLEQAEAFYHAALGLDKIVWGFPGALFLSAGGYHHHVGTNTWSPGPSASEDQAHLMEWELVVPSGPDGADAARSLGQAGFETRNENGAWTVRDPWGTQIRIVADE